MLYENLQVVCKSITKQMVSGCPVQTVVFQDLNLLNKNTENQMENTWFTALSFDSIRKVNERLMGVTIF